MWNDSYDDGFADGYDQAVLDSHRFVEEFTDLLDLALGEATHLADQLDVLKAQLNPTRDDLE